MGNREPVDIQAAFREGAPIDEALRRAVRQALRRHKLLGESVVSYENGRVVIIPPDQIPVDVDEADDAPHHGSAT